MRNPFSRRKESPVAGATLGFYGGRPQYRTTNVEGFAREGYMSNPDVYSAIEIFSNAAGAVDWGVERYVRGEWEALDEHPMLALLRRPNPKMSGTRMIRDLVKWRLIGGEFYLARNTKPSGPPRELWVLPVPRMEIKPSLSAIDPVAYYEYRVGGNRERIEPDHLLHLPRFHPLDDFYGMSPLESVARMIDQATGAADFNLGLLQNGGIPPGFLRSDDELTDSEFARLKKSMDTWGHATQSGKPQLLEGGLTWQSAATSPKDMEMLEAQRMFALKFAQVIGVPAEFLSGAGEKKYSNAAEARKALYTEGVLPELDDIRDALNGWLAPMFGGDVRLVYLSESIDALQEDENARWARADASKDLTIDETRKLKGYEPLPGGAGDVVLVPFSVAPLGSESSGGGSEGEPPAETPPSDDDEPEPAAKQKSLSLGTEERKAAHWKRVDAQRSRVVGKARDSAAARLRAENNAIGKAVADAPNPAAVLKRAEQAIDAGKDEWRTTLEKLALQIAEPFAEETLRDLDASEKSKAAGDWRDGVLRYVKRAVARKVTRITDTTKREIRSIVATAIEEGLSVPDIASRINSLQLEQVIPRRAEVIARTEVVQASNAGSVAAAESTGLDLQKEWIATRDGRERSAHGAMDAKTVPMDEPFEVDGSELLFPGDGSLGADASQVIQCRCTVGYVPA